MTTRQDFDEVYDSSGNLVSRVSVTREAVIGSDEYLAIRGRLMTLADNVNANQNLRDLAKFLLAISPPILTGN